MTSRIWDHFFKDSSKNEFSSTRLFESLDRSFEDKIKSQNIRKKIACKTMRVGADRFSQARNVRNRLSKIRIRNKKRHILVVEVETNESLLADSLIDTNYNSVATFSEDIDSATEIYDEKVHSMVYLVVQMGQDSNCQGPCFYSMTEEKDKQLRESRKELTKSLKPVAEKFTNAEVVVVCGTNLTRCPLANRIYQDPGQSGIFKV